MQVPKPFIIAEMSGNHNQSLGKALEIVSAVAKTGAHALKIQTYTADTITMKGVMKIEDQNSLWNNTELYDLYTKAYTPWEWHKEIFDFAKSLGLIAFSSPFDESSVDFLESLNVPLYKIASFENTHHPLLKKVAQTGKPVIMSTGVSYLEEIEESVNILKSNGCKNITLLKCTSTYPATAENTNLISIPFLKNKFPDCAIGLSDHTMGIGVSVAAVALGAEVIEKHFCISRAEGGVDSAFSMEPHEFTQLVEECEKAQLAMGIVQTAPTKKEKNSLQFKRSIYVKSSIKKGEVFTTDNLQIIRPAFGMHPRHWEEVLGKFASLDLVAGTPLKQEYINEL